MNLVNTCHIRKFGKIFVLLCTIMLTGCGQISSKEPLKATGFYFDTIVSVSLYDGGTDKILDECMELAKYYEDLLSPNIEGSDVWKINHSMGQAVEVKEDTLIVLNTALSYAQLSDGLVDPTIGSLSSLWNFGSGNEEIVPSREEIIAALSHVNYKTILINDSQVSV
ncbi:MAG: FAD:protein FMN transferase, partial [Lachnospiraceae bacterium]|nr:FAD:protein FMN transferase [Lachnospiraceae bacterium]